PEPVQERYLPVAWQAATLRKPGRQTRQAQPMTFGLPWYITSSVTLYNRALLEKAGLDAPPATFAELPDFARTVHEQTGAYGLMPVIAESGNFLKELKKMGIPLYDESGRAIFATD